MVAAPVKDSRFRLSAQHASELAGRFGTPLYVIDEKHFRARIREYREATKAAWPGSEISFASKANSTLALIRIAHNEGCGIDVASEGELRAALAAGVPAVACHFHGNNKQRSELEFALQTGIGTIVLDHFGEIEMVHELLGALGDSQVKVMLRLAPGVDPITHSKISTGQADTKFGFNIADGSGERAVLTTLALGLDLSGFHCHVGSQLVDPEAQRAGGAIISRFARLMKERHGYRAKVINVGGGLGVRYTDRDHPMQVGLYSRLVADAVRCELEGSGLTPILAQEPGRSLVAESGVTLYRVGVTKSVPTQGFGSRTYVSVDGGLSDNPRPALYGSSYSVERLSTAGQSENLHQVTIAGKHCETDILFDGVELPHDTGPGDLIQVLCTGAYNASMASNYNRYPRPGSVLLRESGHAELIQRRESWDEMFAREIVPEDLGS